MSFMKEKESALYSHYIIDGVFCEATPAELLDECMEFPELESADYPDFEDIVDESTEPPLGIVKYDPEKLQEYIKATVDATHNERSFSLLYPEHFTSLQIAKALLDRLWSEGHFRLCNLRLWAQWDWNTRPIGNLASFYKSCQTANEYIFGLGVRMTDYIFIEGDEGCSARFYAWLPEDDIDELQTIEDEIKAPYESRHPWIGEKRRCPSSALHDTDSWLIYIPFDTCPYRLGGSLLSQTCGKTGGQKTNIQDPDYFIDCYEVVRELVEDGIVKAGITVADGGLAVAAGKLCEDSGAELDLKGIIASYGENDIMRIMFGEVPGVLIQISNSDYDYVDSQLLLQDIAYYPIGHPSAEITGITIQETAKTSVADILASLLGHTSEGED
jgi:hypothetical protein